MNEAASPVQQRRGVNSFADVVNDAKSYVDEGAGLFENLVTYFVLKVVEKN